MWCKVVLHDVFVGLYTNVWSSFVPFVDAGLEDAADHVNGEGREVEHDGRGSDLLDGKGRFGLHGANLLGRLLRGGESSKHGDVMGALLWLFVEV